MEKFLFKEIELSKSKAFLKVMRYISENLMYL